MGNLAYPVWADAVATMANLADLHLPTTVNTFNIVIEEEGHRLHSIGMRRPSLTYGQIGQLVEREIRVQPVKPLSFVGNTVCMMFKLLFFQSNYVNKNTFYLAKVLME